jgi:hypothetical protein
MSPVIHISDSRYPADADSTLDSSLRLQIQTELHWLSARPSRALACPLPPPLYQLERRHLR